MNRQFIEQQLALLPIAQYEFFKTQELTFSERVRTVCSTQCPRYGKSWACPPGVGAVNACMKKCHSYPNGLLLLTLHEVSDIANLEQTLATRAPHEALTHRVAALLRSQGISVYALSTESCSICDQCTYPNAPCRHPEKMFPCVESHGIIVTELMESYGIEYQYGNQVVSWVSLLLYR